MSFCLRALPGLGYKTPDFHIAIRGCQEHGLRLRRHFNFDKMKTKAVIAILLISMLMVHDAESWFVRIRLRRIGRAIARVWKPVCNFACPRGCKWVTGGLGSYVCDFGCRHLCGKKKREAIENYHVTPLSRDMDFYDLNDDGYVSIMELSQTLGHTMADSGLLQAFNQTDADQDARLSEEEFFGPNSYFVFSELAPTPTPG